MWSLFGLLTLSGLIQGLWSSVQASELYRQSLAGYPLAKCNDGTPAVYYSSPAADSGPQRKVIIQLQGGGLCNDFDSCLGRCRCNYDTGDPVCEGPLCKAETREVMRRQGILSSDPLSNLPFYDYYKVYLPYCSSDLFSGSRDGSLETGLLQFHGKDIFRSLLLDLNSKINLQNADTLVLTGMSAGAAGVFVNCDFAQQLLPNVTVQCIPDGAGLWPFFPAGCEAFPGTQPDHEFYNGTYDESCMAITARRDWDTFCVQTQFITRHIEADLFVGMGKFDGFFMGTSCVNPGSEQDLDRWNDAMMFRLDQMKAAKENLGLFFPACTQHVLGGSDRGWNDIRIGGQSFADTVDNWLQDRAPYQAVDTCDRPDCAGNC